MMIIRDCGTHEEVLKLSSRTPTQGTLRTVQQTEAAEELSPSFNLSPWNTSSVTSRKTCGADLCRERISLSMATQGHTWIYTDRPRYVPVCGYLLLHTPCFNMIRNGSPLLVKSNHKNVSLFLWLISVWKILYHIMYISYILLWPPKIWRKTFFFTKLFTKISFNLARSLWSSNLNFDHFLLKKVELRDRYILIQNCIRINSET